MDKKFIDPNLKRKKNLVEKNITLIKKFPLFSLIEFNIFGTCNRNCTFCPVSNPQIYTKTQESFNINLFEKVISDLSSVNYSGTILFSAFSEPLLHKHIDKLICIAKQSLPLSRIEIVSNGDLLTTKKLKSLFSSGLDTINISMYDGKEQIKHFQSMRKEAGLNEKSVVLRRRYYENGNFGLTISNRAGVINSNKFRDKQEKEIKTLPLNSKCYYPFYSILVDLNGNILLCPHDWQKRMVFGNIKNDNIIDIWYEKKIENIRKNLAKANRNFTPCNQCDVIGTLIGQENFDKWGKCHDL